MVSSRCKSAGLMTASGHSRPARAGTKPGHVRYAPIAIKFRSEAKCRDGHTIGLMHGYKVSPYSITSSARRRIAGGTVRPSAFAALRLSISSSLLG
jgi:hypothetical protein